MTNPGGERGTVVYETTVTAVGEQVPAFVGAGILVLFGDHAPEELHDISALHHPEVTEAAPEAGDTVWFDDHAVPVLAVGDVVRDNLLNLGHMDFKADDRTDPHLPGDVHVPKGSLVLPEVGQVIRVTRPAQS